MNEAKHPRAVIGLIVLAILCTMAIGLQEQRSAPLAAHSIVEPASAGPRALYGLRDPDPQGDVRALPWLRIGTRAFWLAPWPWIVVGLAGFGLLAGGFLWKHGRMERD